MTIGEMIRQGFHYARTCKSMWVFGFVVALASGGSSGGGGGGQNDGAAAGPGGLVGLVGLLGLFGLSTMHILIVVAAAAVVILGALILRFISEGALIEGVVRARHGAPITTGDGFRLGWAHWGVLFRIGVIYFVVLGLSLVVLIVPVVLAFRALGAPAGFAVLLPALAVAVPWMVTVHLIQAFAMRIAVLENRRALDAIARARLFLHGRLMHGLKLTVATFVGTLALLALALVTIAPVVLLVRLVGELGPLPLIAYCVLVIIPVFCVVTAMTGTLRSSIWTIGYVTEVQS